MTPVDTQIDEHLPASIQKVKRGIARLVDAYEEGLLEKSEFEPRIRRSRDRLAKLEAEAKKQAENEAQRTELRLVIGHLQEFADRIKSGLHDADWLTRREIIRALVKRVEVDEAQVRVIYRIDPLPFDQGPARGPFARLLEAWPRPCSRTCSCTTCSTSGFNSGVAATLQVTSSSCAMPMISWWVSSIGQTPNGS